MGIQAIGIRGVTSIGFEGTVGRTEVKDGKFAWADDVLSYEESVLHVHEGVLVIDVQELAKHLTVLKLVILDQ